MKGLYCCILFFISLTAFGQSDGDYRSRQNGNWNSVSTWQVYDNGAWVNLESSPNYANVIPSSVSGPISIQANTTVSINTQSITADQITVQGNAELEIQSAGELKLLDGVGVDLFIQEQGTIVDPETEEEIDVPAGLFTIQSGGILENAGQVTSVAGNLDIYGVYEHNQNAGAIPLATWNANSATKITGSITSGSVIGGLSQTFYDFIWEPISQTNNKTLITAVNPGLTTIANNFEIRNTNSSGGFSLSLTTATINHTVIQGNLVISGNSRFNIGVSSNATIVVHGNAAISSTVSGPSLRITQSGTTGQLTVFGDLSIVGNSDIDLCDGIGAGTLELRGNLSFGGGLITVSGSSSTSAVRFAKNSTAPQNVTKAPGGGFAGTINYTINLNSQTNLGELPLTGSGTLNLLGKLGVGSTHIDGAVQSGTTGGNIQLPLANRSFGTAATIVYNGAGPQYLGDAFPTGVNMEIANASGVTNNNIGVTNVVADLRLTSGSLNIGNTNTLNIQSNFFVTGGTIGGSDDSDLIFSGSGTLNPLSFTVGMQEINNLTVSRPTELVLGSDLAVFGAIDLPGGNLNFSGRTLTINGSSITTNGTGLRSTLSTSNLVFGGSTFSGAIPFSGSGNQLNKLIFSTNGGSYTWTSTVVVNDSLKLNLGALTHSSGLTMANDAVLLKAGGTITGSSPVVSGSDQYNVTYTGQGNTGVELPSSATALGDLRIASSGTVTLTQAIKVNGSLFLSNGTFDSNGLDIEIVEDFVGNANSDFADTNITFSGTSTTISGSNVTFDDLTITGTVSVNATPQWNIAGNLVNDGSLSVIAGTANFIGTTTISGASISNFRSVRVQGILNAPTQMNVAAQFSFVNGGTFDANGGTVNFTGAPSTLSNVGNITFHHILITGALTSSATLNLSGDFTDNGTFTRGTGTVVFNGSSTQLIGGTSVTDFHNLSITNIGGPPAVQVISNKNLRGVLTLSAGTILDPDGPSGSVVFRLRSTGDVFSPGVTNDAAIATLPSGAVVDGNVTIERYMALEGTNNNRVYRYISSPIRNAPVSQLIDNFKISGTFTGSNQAGKQSMFAYTETATTDTDGNGVFNINDGYLDFPANNITETMDNGRGYSIFVYGNESPYTINGNALWDVRGVINSGEVVFNAFTTLTNSSDPSGDGWNLVGNPYPSTIDWDAASGWTKTGIANAIYMRNNGQTSPVYATYVNGVGTNGGSRYIPIGQAFQVRATGTPINFRANEAVKVGGQQATYFREIPQERIRITLDDGSVRDEMVVRFTDAATDGFDPEWDAHKLPNYKLNLSSLTSENEKFAINSLAGLTCGKTVKLSMTDVPVGSYSLNFSEFESISMEIGIQLFDSYTATTTNVRQEAYYMFEVTEDVNSFGNNRFELRFISKEVPDFTAYADDVCQSTQAFVNITDSESGVRYRIMKNGTSLTDWQAGTGANMALQLQTAQLVVGENLLSIQASIEDCETLFLDKPLQLNVVPLAEIESVKDGSSCGTGKVVISAEGSNDGNYKWYESETDQAPITGAVNGTFITPELNKTKTYYVSSVNELGCESARRPVVATVVIIDDVSISVDSESDKLTSSYQVGNQWFLNGEKIPGATNQSIEVTETGLYEVEASVNSCITRASVEMIVLGSEGGKANGISFYPNPVSDILYIELPDSSKPAKGEISTSAGHPVGSIDFSNGKAEFNFAGHAAGLYLVKVTQGTTVVHYKIIKK